MESRRLHLIGAFFTLSAISCHIEAATISEWAQVRLWCSVQLHMTQRRGSLDESGVHVRNARTTASAYRVVPVLPLGRHRQLKLGS